MSDQVSRERIQDLLTRAKRAASTMQPPSGWHDMASALEELLALREQARWIPVSERLPGGAGDVLVLMEASRGSLVDSRQTVAWLDGDDNWYSSVGEAFPVHVIDKPVAWRPLLPAPERTEINELRVENNRLRDELASVRKATIEDEAQAKMGEWVRSRLGDSAMRAHERGMRFLEESLELAQAVGVEEVSVMNLTRFVFSRDKGVVAQEIGGVGTTLLALSESQSIPMMEAIQAEIDRIHSLPMEKFRKRQQLNAEAGIGALPIRALAEGGSQP